VKAPVIDVIEFMKAFANEAMLPVMFVTVVLASVLEPEALRLVLLRVVIVEFVSVASVAIKLVMLPVTAFVVVAFDVDALLVTKLLVLPNRELMNEDVNLAIEAKRFVLDAVVEKRFVRVALLPNKFVVYKFVLVLLVFVELPDASTVNDVTSTQFVPFHLNVELVAVPEAIDPPEPVTSVPQVNWPVAALYRSLSVVLLQAESPAPFRRVSVLVPLTVNVPVFRFVDVELVNVLLIESRFDDEMFEEDNVVIVEFVSVALVAVRLFVFVVLALVVDA
jgi:hypothetical protein